MNPVYLRALDVDDSDNICLVLDDFVPAGDVVLVSRETVDQESRFLGQFWLPPSRGCAWPP